MELSPPTQAQIEDTLQPNLIAGVAIVGASAIIAVVLRVVARRRRNLELGWDDYSIFVALLLCMGLCVAILIGAHYGLGKHINTIAMDDFIRESKCFYATQVLWAASIPAVKVSVLLLYVRLFSGVQYIRYSAWFFGVYSIIWGIMVVFVVSLECRPFEYRWNLAIEGSCIDRKLFYIIGTGFNTVTDLIILLLPLPIIFGLHTTVAKKIQLCGIFLLGSLTCGISCARWVAIFQLTFDDPTYDLVYPSVWSAAEPCLGIVAACLATLRPLFMNPFGSRNRSHVSEYSGEGSERMANLDKNHRALVTGDYEPVP